MLPRRGHPNPSRCQPGPIYACSRTVSYTHPARSVSYTHPARSGSYTQPARSGSDAHPARTGSYTHPARSGSNAHPARSGSNAHPACTASNAHPDTAGSDTDPARTDAHAAGSDAHTHAARAGGTACRDHRLCPLWGFDHLRRGASDAAHAYVTLMDATVAGPNTNFCNFGDQAADTALLVYAHADASLLSLQAFTAMTGTNDVWLCGPFPGCVANYTQELSASLAWLAMPVSDKVLAQQSTVRTGVWTNDDFVRPGMGLASSAGGSSLTLSVQQKVADRRLYLAWRATDGSTASATVEIDGTLADTLYGYGNDGVPVHTQNGHSSTVFLKTYPLGAVGTHTVRLTVQPGSAVTDPFTVLWAGAPGGTYTLTGVPHLIVGGILAENWGLRADITLLYDGLVQAEVNALRADGMDVQFAAVHDLLTAPDDYVDILHPNDVGHKKIAAAFLAVP